jgi:hypothetical protein
MMAAVRPAVSRCAGCCRTVARRTVPSEMPVPGSPACPSAGTAPVKPEALNPRLSPAVRHAAHRGRRPLGLRPGQGPPAADAAPVAPHRARGRGRPGPQLRGDRRRREPYRRHGVRNVGRNGGVLCHRLRCADRAPRTRVARRPRGAHLSRRGRRTRRRALPARHRPVGAARARRRTRRPGRRRSAAVSPWRPASCSTTTRSSASPSRRPAWY